MRHNWRAGRAARDDNARKGGGAWSCASWRIGKGLAHGVATTVMCRVTHGAAQGAGAGAGGGGSTRKEGRILVWVLDPTDVRMFPKK